MSRLHELLDAMFDIEEPELFSKKPWPNYVELLKLTPEDTADLIAIATDARQFDEEEVWVCNVHAWRALGQLRASEASEPLLSLTEWDADAVLEELPSVYGLIGEAALPTLGRALQQQVSKSDPNYSVAECIAAIGEESEALREQAIALLSAPLQDEKRYNRELNGMVASMLLKLEAVEAAPVLEAAYGADRVSTQFCGTWASVQVDLRLRDRSEFSPEELRPLYRDMGRVFRWHQEHQRLRDAPERFFAEPQTKKEKTAGFGSGVKPKKKSKQKKKKTRG